MKSMLVVAGPRGIGKSTFIRRMQSGTTDCPPALTALRDGTYPVVQMQQLSTARHPAAIVHVDFFTPFAALPPLAVDDLCQAIRVEVLVSYPHFRKLAGAEQLHVVTLYAARHTALTRFLSKVGRDRGFTWENLLRIYSDAYHNRVFDHLYATWLAYVAHLAPAGHWTVTVDDESPVQFQETSHGIL